MKILTAACASAALIALAGRQSEPENIQARAENTSQALEEKANSLTAEAEGDANLAAQTLENQYLALENQNQAAANQAGANEAQKAQ